MTRAPFSSERIKRTDPRTGLTIIQITSYPVPSNPFPYDWPSITPDNRTLFFLSRRYAGRQAPWDIWRCDTDGLGLYQLTNHGEGRPIARMKLDGKALYVGWQMEPRIWHLDAESGSLEMLVDLEPALGTGHPIGGPRIMPDGRLCVGRGRGEGPIGGREGFDWYAVDPSDGSVEPIPVEGTILGFDFSRNRIVVIRDPYTMGTETRADGTRIYANTNERPMSAWTYDMDGGDEQFLSEWLYAHGTVLEKTGSLHGPGFPPNHCVWLTEPGKEPVRVVEGGPYFWHSGGSWDGEWTVTDSNWPDQGLQLVNIPARRYATLCQPGATQDHVQDGHPHPLLSMDGRICVFGSDRTGVQVYAVHITDEYRDRLIAGETFDPYKDF